MSASIDANILVYADNVDDPAHGIARDLIERLSAGPDLLYLFWPTILGYLRIVTHPAILRDPVTTTEAVHNIEALLSLPHIVAPGERHADILARLLLVAGSAGNLTNDAHLAAIAIEQNAVVGTFDHDFKRFSGVKFQLLS